MIFLFFYLFIIMSHELGHALAAMIAGIRVKTISLGMFHPYLEKKFKNTSFRITPWIVGGYTEIAGEYSFVEGGFLKARYLAKLLVVLAGVFVNFITLALLYLWNYGSFAKGLLVDLHLIKLIFTKKPVIEYLISIQPQVKSISVISLSALTLMAILFNILPIPALDGAWIWEPLLIKIYKNKSPKVLKVLNNIGFLFLLVIQFILIWYLVK